MEMINATGRRKTAVARVYVRQGSGNIQVNGRDYKQYFPVVHVQGKVVDPLLTVEVQTLYDINVNVKGGGIKGQAEAVRFGYLKSIGAYKWRLPPCAQSQKIPYSRPTCR